MSKPSGADLFLTSHISAYGAKNGGITIGTQDLRVFCNPETFQKLANDFAEYGTAMDNEILNRKRPIIEEMHTAFSAKKPRIDAFRDQAIADIKEVCGEKHRYADFMLAAKRVRSVKRNAASAAKAAYEAEVVEKIDAIFADLGDVEMAKAKILEIVIDINTKAASARADVDEDA